MKKSKWYSSVFMGVVLLLSSLVVACGEPSPAAETPPSEQISTPEQPPPAEQEQPTKKPAEFKLSSLTFAPSTIMVGDSATVTATVKNTGDLSGTYTAVVAIDGEEIDRKEVSVEPGESEEVSFEIPTTTACEYKVAVGELTGVAAVHGSYPSSIVYAEEPSNSRWTRFLWGDFGHVVHFTPPPEGFRIQGLGIKCKLQVRDDAELDERQFTVRIFDSAKTQQLWSQDFPWRVLSGPFIRWYEMDVPDIRVDGDFFVEVVTHSDESKQKFAVTGFGSYIGLCYKEPGKDPYIQPYVGRSGISHMVGDTLGHVEPVDIEWFIRVEGERPSSR